MILNNRRKLLIHIPIHFIAVIVRVIRRRRLIICVKAILNRRDNRMDEIRRVYLLTVIIQRQIDIRIVIGDIILDCIVRLVFHIHREDIHPRIRMTRVSLFTVINRIRRYFVEFYPAYAAYAAYADYTATLLTIHRRLRCYDLLMPLRLLRLLRLLCCLTSHSLVPCSLPFYQQSSLPQTHRVCCI